MTSFQTGIKGNRRAAARFIRKAHRAIQKAYESRKVDGVTQTSIADALEVHRSVINRQLRGTEDISVGRVAEFAWAMGYDVDLAFIEKAAPTNNMPAPQIPALAPATNAVLEAPEGSFAMVSLGVKVVTSGVTVQPTVHHGESFKVRIDA